MRLYVVGASGRVGRELVGQALRRGHSVTAQTRGPGKLAPDDRLRVARGEPTDTAFLARSLPGHDAVAFVLGVDHSRPTTLFSDATRALLAAMGSSGVARLVAVTGVGAGETRGHGGWIYDRVIHPLFTRHRYEDKDRQERLIEASGLDWTIVRPARSSNARTSEPLEVLTSIPRGARLTRIAPAEVASFILDELAESRFIGAKPFIGHRR